MSSNENCWQGRASGRRRARRAAAVISVSAGALTLPAAALASPARSAQRPQAAAASGQLSTIFSGATLGLTKPDDVTTLAGNLYVGFQNGLGPQGQPSSTGARTSEVVELTGTGLMLGKWALPGHVDGVTADPAAGMVIATVNEDGNSRLFTIGGSTGRLASYRYSVSPLPSHGGTDAISIWRGMILVSASAPGTTGKAAPQASYPAVYVVSLHNGVASVSPFFSDEASATAADAAAGSGSVKLGLTDPDSSAVVPPMVPGLGGDFVLDSQGDRELVFAGGGATSSGPAKDLAVLELSQAIDDLTWATSSNGVLYVTDSTNDLVEVLHGPFTPGTAIVDVTPCDANNAPKTCANPWLGTLDLTTGKVSPYQLGGQQVQPGGLAFVEAAG